MNGDDRAQLEELPREAKTLETRTIHVRDRVKELIRCKGRDIRPHPENWRVHPENQLAALRGVLDDVGIAGALLVYHADDGVLTLIDGEARVTEHPNIEWPCLVLDVDDAEARYLLETFDPLTNLAEADAEKLEQLLSEVKTENAAVQAMLQELADAAGLCPDLDPENARFPEFDESAEKDVEYLECPKCGHRWPK